MRKFPDINQFRHTVESVVHKATYVGQSPEDTPLYDESRPKPVLTFTGTTKLHGTNGGIAFDLKANTLGAQSRERELTLEDDNHGFCAWALSAAGSATLSKLRETVERMEPCPKAVSIHIFGEWCGPTINTKTGIGLLPCRFVGFAVLVTDEAGDELWLNVSDVAAAFYADGSARPVDFCFISEFKQWAIAVDFNDPSSALEQLETLTLAVEQSCPVATALGGGGIGEGIVWVNQDPRYGRHVFKTKGERHKGTRSARLVSIAPEILANQEAFVKAVLTESRLEQAYEVIKSEYGKVTLEVMGQFLMWVGQDVLKEESDTLKASGLSRKDVMGPLNRRAKAWVTPLLAKI